MWGVSTGAYLERGDEKRNRGNHSWPDRLGWAMTVLKKRDQEREPRWEAVMNWLIPETF